MIEERVTCPFVPNAGTATRTDLAGADLDQWQQTLSVNLTAPYLLARAAVPGMAERGFGRVLFVSSVAAFTGGVTDVAAWPVAGSSPG